MHLRILTEDFTVHVLRYLSEVTHGTKAVRQAMPIPPNNP